MHERIAKDFSSAQKIASSKYQSLLQLGYEHPNRYYRSEVDEDSLKKLGGFAATFKICDDDDAVGPCSSGRLRTHEDIFSCCDAGSDVRRCAGCGDVVCRHCVGGGDVHPTRASHNRTLHDGSLRNASHGNPRARGSRSCGKSRVEQDGGGDQSSSARPVGED